jgi:hypothetical protein
MTLLDLSPAIQPTVPYGGGSVMVWECISYDCKLDLVTIQGNLTGDQYIRDVLQPVVVPHFDNHPPWGIGCIFVSPNPHSAVVYMKQKLALVWLMDLAPCL